MGFKFYKYFDEDALAIDGSHEEEWSPTEDVVIKRIHLARKNGSSFTDSTFYLKVGKEVYTMDVVPCAVLGPDKLTSPVLEIPVKAKATLSFVLKNLEGVAIDVMETFECWGP